MGSAATSSLARHCGAPAPGSRRRPRIRPGRDLGGRPRDRDARERRRDGRLITPGSLRFCLVSRGCGTGRTRGTRERRRGFGIRRRRGGGTGHHAGPYRRTHVGVVDRRGIRMSDDTSHWSCYTGSRNNPWISSRPPEAAVRWRGARSMRDFTCSSTIATCAAP